eukprot:scaffold9176_cov104-Isochrysis_galbana.AAC.1
MPPIRPRHRTRLPTAAATTLPMRPPCRLALGGPSAMSCASSCSNRRIASSPRATAARAGTVSKARCLCHGTPPTSSGLHPGGGGARFGSDTSSILCRSGAVRRRSSSMLTDGGGGCANRRCFRGSGRSGAPAATCFGSRPPFGNRTSLPAAGFSHRSQPCPLGSDAPRPTARRSIFVRWTIRGARRRRTHRRLPDRRRRRQSRRSPAPVPRRWRADRWADRRAWRSPGKRARPPGGRRVWRAGGGPRAPGTPPHGTAGNPHTPPAAPARARVPGGRASGVRAAATRPRPQRRAGARWHGPSVSRQPLVGIRCQGRPPSPACRRRLQTSRERGSKVG